MQGFERNEVRCGYLLLLNTERVQIGRCAINCVLQGDSLGIRHRTTTLRLAPQSNTNISAIHAEQLRPGSEAFNSSRDALGKLQWVQAVQRHERPNQVVIAELIV